MNPAPPVSPGHAGIGVALGQAGQALAQSANPNWWALAFAWCLVNLPQGWVGQPEQWRYAISGNPRIGPPRSDKVWGALTTALLKSNVIERTGNRVRMISLDSHGRQTDEYRRL